MRTSVAFLKLTFFNNFLAKMVNYGPPERRPRPVRRFRPVNRFCFSNQSRLGNRYRPSNWSRFGYRSRLVNRSRPANRLRLGNRSHPGSHPRSANFPRLLWRPANRPQYVNPPRLVNRPRPVNGTFENRHRQSLLRLLVYAYTTNQPEIARIVHSHLQNYERRWRLLQLLSRVVRWDPKGLCNFMIIKWILRYFLSCIYMLIKIKFWKTAELFSVIMQFYFCQYIFRDFKCSIDYGHRQQREQI